MSMEALRPPKVCEEALLGTSAKSLVAGHPVGEAEQFRATTTTTAAGGRSDHTVGVAKHYFHASEIAGSLRTRSFRRAILASEYVR